MTYTLTTDESKVAECGSVDFSKFTDSTKGYTNIDSKTEGIGYGVSFIAQDVLDAGFTEAEGKTIIESLTTKGVIKSFTYSDFIETFWADYNDTTDAKKHITDSVDKKTAIDSNWIFFLTEQFINDKAKT